MFSKMFGHIERSTGLMAQTCKLEVVGQKNMRRPKKMWNQVEWQCEAWYKFNEPSKPL